MKPVFYLGGVALLILGINLFGQDEPADTTSAKPEQTQAKHLILPSHVISNAVNEVEHTLPQSVVTNLPFSLRNSPLPESLSVGEHGQLVIEDKIKKLFDFYLSAIGEAPLASIIARIKHQLSETLDGVAYEQAVEILEHYLQYRNQLAIILQDNQQDGDSPRNFEEIALLQQQIKDTRAGLFDADVIAAFFAKQDEYDNYMLARQMLKQQAELSDEQKRQARQLLDANTPQWLLDQQHQGNALNDYREQVTVLHAQGDASGARSLAEQSFGVEAADRLDLLYQQRQHWRNTLAVYHQKLSEVLDNSGLDEHGRQMQIEALRTQYFEQTQIKRVAAIDHIKFGL